jgi:hypothetical protein
MLTCSNRIAKFTEADRNTKEPKRGRRAADAKAKELRLVLGVPGSARMICAAATSRVSISHEGFAEGRVRRVDVEPGKRPTFVHGGKADADLYVRLNNSTRLLNTADAVEYVNTHWR